tara:strand:+ start:1715 stop:1930 length:216 start_codon:yes stop_codon:yes gene_type:complete
LTFHPVNRFRSAGKELFIPSKKRESSPLNVNIYQNINRKAKPLIFLNESSAKPSLDFAGSFSKIKGLAQVF